MELKKPLDTQQKRSRQFENKWIESTEKSRMLGLNMALETAEKGEDEKSPVETFFLTQYWLLSDWLS